MRREASKLSLIVRSTIFNLVFVFASIFGGFSVMLFFWLPRRFFMYICAPYFKSIPVFEKYILGLTSEIVGKEHLPTGPCIIAMKHQSPWETIKVIEIIDDPVIVYKRSNHWIPGFGWAMYFWDMIPIDRSRPLAALKTILRKSKVVLKENRQIIIFPEGTCAPVGEKLPYKQGVAAVYKQNNVPVVPVALNSGVFWKKGSFIKYPGKITMKILEPIQPGLSADVMMQKLENTIETESDKLLENYKGTGYAL